MMMRPLTLLLFTLGLLLPAGLLRAEVPATRPTEAAPLAVSRIEQQTAEGVIRGWVAKVDLADPRIQVVVSDPRDEEGKYRPRATEEWARERNLDLAVNANYFGTGGPIGLSVGDGKMISPPRGVDPVLLICEDHAAVVVGREPDLTGVRQAVAGVGATPKVPLGAALLTDGKNTGAEARVAADQRHPRTAVGVGESGRTLIVMAIDGRQPEWSVGVTLPELADLMRRAGASDAINLDGGGSTAFYWRDDSGVVHHNRPSEGEHRPVAVSLGVRVKPN